MSALGLLAGNGLGIGQQMVDNCIVHHVFVYSVIINMTISVVLVLLGLVIINLNMNIILIILFNFNA